MKKFLPTYMKPFYITYIPRYFSFIYENCKYYLNLWINSLWNDMMMSVSRCVYSSATVWRTSYNSPRVYSTPLAWFSVLCKRLFHCYRLSWSCYDPLNKRHNRFWKLPFSFRWPAKVGQQFPQQKKLKTKSALNASRYDRPRNYELLDGTINRQLLFDLFRN